MRRIAKGGRIQHRDHVIDEDAVAVAGQLVAVNQHLNVIAC